MRVKTVKCNDNPEGSSPIQGLSSSTEGASRPLPVLDATELFRGRKQVALRFGDAVYHLKITRLGKLILNK